MAMFVAPWPFRYSSIAFLALLSLLEQEVITRGVPRHSTNRAKSALRVWECLLIIGTLLTRRALYFQAASDEKSTAYLREAFTWVYMSNSFWLAGILGHRTTLLRRWRTSST